MKFLITGGAGSVGQTLTSSLLQKGHTVRVLDKRADLPVPLARQRLKEAIARCYRDLK